MDSNASIVMDNGQSVNCQVLYQTFSPLLGFYGPFGLFICGELRSTVVLPEKLRLNSAR